MFAISVSPNAPRGGVKRLVRVSAVINVNARVYKEAFVDLRVRGECFIMSSDVGRNKSQVKVECALCDFPHISGRLFRRGLL